MSDKHWYQRGPREGLWLPSAEPTEATPIGEADREPLGVYLGNTAMDAIERTLAGDTGTPSIGLLIGYPLMGPERPILLVTDSIPLPGAAGDDGRPLFSPSVMAIGERVFHERYGDAAVAGWYSAGPRSGPEVTSYEKYAHHRFFSEPWQIALLIDSAYRTSRLYRWDDETLAPCDCFYYWNRSAEPVGRLRVEGGSLSSGAAQAASSADVDFSQDRPRRRLFWPWIAAALVAVYLLLPDAPGSLMWLRARQADERRNLEQLHESLVRVESQSSELEALASSPVLSQSAPSSSDPTSPASGEALEVAASAAASGTSRTGATAVLSSGVSGEGDAAYVVQPGDNLWRISGSLLGDPLAFRTLAAENAIPDPDTIFPGQRLRLPNDATSNASPPSSSVPDEPASSGETPTGPGAVQGEPDVADSPVPGP